MANKTQPTDASVPDFLAAVGNDIRRADAIELDALMSAVTGHPGVLWGPSMIGYGSQSYANAKGQTADSFPVGFSPRKASLVLYFMNGLDDDLLARLGRHKRGVACLYVTRLDDVDRTVLREMIDRAFSGAAGT